MRIDLGCLVPVLKGWMLCIDGCNGGCAFCVELPEELNGLNDAEKLYVALYITARRVLDYRIAAAMHIHFVKNRAMVEPELLVKALRSAKIMSKIPPAIEEDSPYAWEAVKWRGIVYAQMILDSGKRRRGAALPP